jgi:hypothetical protein
MEKVVRGSTVAVIYSPDFGSGWFSWNPDYPALMFDPRVVAWIENGSNHDTADELLDYLQDTYPGGYFNLKGLEVRYIPVGCLFRIDEYDGAEVVMLKDDYTWYVA